MRKMRWIVASIVGFGMLLSLGITPQATLADGVVVDGLPFACDQAGLASAISAASTTDPVNPGKVTFSCPSNTITFNTSIEFSGSPIQAVVIDGSNGGNQIILDGGDSASFFAVTTGGNLTIQNITLKNGSSNEGGAINVATGGVLQAIDATFTNNEARRGGAIANIGGTVTVNKSRLEGNDVDGDGTGSFGGAIYNDGTLTVDSSGFIQNEAGGGPGTSYGGAIYNNGTLDVSRSSFYLNEVGGGGGNSLGGAIHNQGSLDINQSTFIYNAAGGGAGASYGGAINDTKSATISQSTFIYNAAGGGGGAGYGGAIAIMGGSTAIVASTLAVNASPNGASIYSDDQAINPKVAWSTIGQSDISSSPALVLDGPLTLEGVILGGFGTHCLFTGGTLNDSYTLSNNDSCNLSGVGSDDSIPFSDGSTNLGLSTAAQITDDETGIVHVYFPLLDDGPAIDAGPSSCDTGIMEDTDPEPDQLGNARPFGPACDIGAIEFIEPISLCANRWNGSLRVSEQCSRSETLIELPNDAPITICVNDWNGTASLGDDCDRDEHSLTITRDGQIAICVNRWNGVLRVSDRCSRSEYEDWL